MIHGRLWRGDRIGIRAKSARIDNAPNLRKAKKEMAKTERKIAGSSDD